MTEPMTDRGTYQFSYNGLPFGPRFAYDYVGPWPALPDQEEPSVIDPAELENRFAYHPPLTDKRRQAHDDVRGLCLAMAERLNRLLPDGREKSVAVTNLEQVMFWSNAALARTPDDSGDPR